MVAPLLLAVDFSPSSRVALAAAQAMAVDLHAPIVLVHALDSATPTIDWKATAPSSSARFEALDQGESARLASEWAETLRAAGIAVDVVVRPGCAAELAVEEAKARGCAFIVVGTAGLSGVRGWLMGSVAQAVLRHSPVPVLVVPTRMLTAKNDAKPSQRKVLVAVDFSKDSEAAYEAGLRLARDLRCGVHLVHVVDIPFTNATFPYSEAILSPEMIASDEAHALESLASLANQARKLQVGVTPAVQVGHVPSSILAEARTAGASVIVVGTHGKSGFRHFILGSVAQALVQMADRPVLVVPNTLAGESGGWLR